MADAIIQFTLRGGEDEARAFEPGQRVRGTVQLIPDSGNLNCKHIFIRLQWHTEGRGRDQQRITQLDVFQGTTSPHSTTLRLHFAAPAVELRRIRQYRLEIEVEVRALGNKSAPQ